MATPARPVIELPPQYDPSVVEASAYERWQAAGAFTAGRPDHADRPPFSLVIPPPNVTGSLHMGHAFEHALMDALTRRKRMQGYDALWLPGMDHAGIATQNVVEREIAKEGLSRHDIGREAFVERVWEWKARVRRPHPRPDAPPGRRRRLVARALHDGRRAQPRAVRHDVQAALRPGPDLPRRAHHQLVSALPHGAVRHRGGPPRGRRRARSRSSTAR